MTGIRHAVAALETAEAEARAIIAAARLELGRQIRIARDEKNAAQKDIAAELRLTREQVRRLQEAADLADGLKPSKPANSR